MVMGVELHAGGIPTTLWETPSSKSMHKSVHATILMVQLRTVRSNERAVIRGQRCVLGVTMAGVCQGSRRRTHPSI